MIYNMCIDTRYSLDMTLAVAEALNSAKLDTGMPLGSRK